MGTAPRVAIIGSGFGGIAMATRLLADGVEDVVLLERFEDAGGTWRDNTYPGAACDIPSHLYSLADDPNPDWSRHYAPQPEIRAYLDRIVEARDLKARTRFGFDVREATWDEATATWTLTSASGETVTAEVLINAVGGLKDPKLPSVPGLDGFDGPVIHSARWDHDVDLFGKRVGVIGTGASSIQLVPQLAEVASELTVLQRTPPWIVPRMDRSFSGVERAALRYVPGLRAGFRGLIYAEHELFRQAFTEGTRLHRIGTALATAHLRRQVKDPALREKLRPDYTFGCKRVLRSDDYYPALCRDNVEVETTAIARVEEDGIVFADGRRVELDAIVLGTGFKVDDPLNGMVVTGRNGRDLDAFWDGRPSAHLGMTVPGFPNNYMVLGPNAGLGHNSALLMIEAAVGYIADAVQQMRERDVAALDVAEHVHTRFVDWVDEQVAGSSWSGGCASWYLNDRGENFSLWPGTVGAYRRATRHIDLSEYIITRHQDLPTRTEVLA